jgi:hypothetical protein
MAGTKINFAEVESSTFEPLPEGNYSVVVDRVEVRESKSSEHFYLNWELEVTDEDHENQRLWMITSLSPKAAFRLKDVFLALGVIDGEEDAFEMEWDDQVEVTPKEGPLLINPEVDGLAAIAVVQNEMYNGKEQNRVNELLAMDEVEEKPKERTKKASGAKASRKRKLR